MTAKSIGVITVAIAVTPALGAPAVAAAATPVAKSYAELLEPIPNAVEKLRASDLAAQQRPARLIKAEWGGDEHHHHHHHHHHHNYGYAPAYDGYGYGYAPSYGYSTYYVQPYGYVDYGRNRRWRQERREHHHHHHHRR